MEAEGFTKVEFVGKATAADNTLVSGDAEMGMLFLGPFLQRLEPGPGRFSPMMCLASAGVANSRRRNFSPPVFSEMIF